MFAKQRTSEIVMPLGSSRGERWLPFDCQKLTRCAPKLEQALC